MTEVTQSTSGMTSIIELGSFPTAGVAVIFGSGGGVGSALVEALKSNGRFSHLVGFSRKTAPSIDLMDEASPERAAGVAAEMGELRLVIDATGFLHDDGQRPEKSWRQLNIKSVTHDDAMSLLLSFST